MSAIAVRILLDGILDPLAFVCRDDPEQLTAAITDAVASVGASDNPGADGENAAEQVCRNLYDGDEPWDGCSLRFPGGVLSAERRG